MQDEVNRFNRFNDFNRKTVKTGNFKQENSENF